MVDDSHAVGFIGARGAGTPERCGVEGRVAARSAERSARLWAAPRAAISRAPSRSSICCASARGPTCSPMRWPRRSPRRRSRRSTSSRRAPICAPNLSRNAAYFRKGLARGRLHPDARRASDHSRDDRRRGGGGRLADELQQRGVYVTAFSYPVVPHGKARIRTQMNAAHSLADLDRAIAAFAAAGRAVGLIA